MKKLTLILLIISLILISAMPVCTFAQEEEVSTLIRRPIPTEFEKSNSIDDIKYYNSTNYTEFYKNTDIGNEVLTAYDFYNNSALGGTESTYANAETVTLENEDFTKAVRISVNTIPSNETSLVYNVGINNSDNGVIKLDTTDTYLLSFCARLVSGGTNGVGTIKHQIQENIKEENDPYKKALFKETTISSDWDTYYIPFSPVSGYSTYTYSIRLGYALQVIEIADLRITYQGNTYSPEDFPTDKEPAINPTLLTTYEANSYSKISGIESSYGSFEITDVTDQPFNKAIRLTTNTVASKDTRLLFNIAPK